MILNSTLFVLLAICIDLSVLQSIKLNRYHAKLIHNSRSCCGAFISPTCVLTLAQCVRNTKVVDWVVRGGEVSWNNRGVQATLQRILIPPQTPGYDVAIMKLNGRITNGRDIVAIALDDIPIKAGDEIDTSGWDIISGTRGRMHAKVVDEAECRRRYPNNALLTPLTFCAVKADNGRCFGDLGCPSVRNGKLVGIVSKNIQCTNGNNVGIEYSRIDKALPWINNVMLQFCQH